MDSNKRQNTHAFSAFFRSFANSCYIAFCIAAIVTSLQIEMNQLAASARQGPQALRHKLYMLIPRF